MDFLFPHVSVRHMYYVCADIPGGFKLTLNYVTPNLSTLNKSLQRHTWFCAYQMCGFVNKTSLQN